MAITVLHDSGTLGGEIFGSDPGGVAVRTDSDGNNLVLTGNPDRDRHLKLTSWRISHDGVRIAKLHVHIARHDDAAVEFAVVSAARDFFIGATLMTGNRLRVSSWRVDDSDGAIHAGEEIEETEKVALLPVYVCQSPLGDGRVIIGVINAHGNLVLKTYEVTSDGRLQPVFDTLEQMEKVVLTAMTYALWNKRVYTVVLAVGGDRHLPMRIVGWRILSRGEIEREADTGVLDDRYFSVHVVTLGDLLVTVGITLHSHLKLVSWRISADGKKIERLSQWVDTTRTVDRVSPVAFLDEEFGTDRVGRIVAVTSSGEQLGVTAWRLDRSGECTRGETFDGRVEPVDSFNLRSLSLNVDLSVVCLQDRTLELVTWQVDRFAQAHTLPNNLLLDTPARSENTTQVVPPGRSLAQGRIVTQFGRSPGLSYRDLLDNSGTIATDAPKTHPSYPPYPTESAPASHNQIIRLRDGSLLASRNWRIWTSSPKADWFGAKGLTNGTERNGVRIFRSTDQGTTWKLVSTIDSVDAHNGEFGWPQPGDGGYGIGGFARTELYQDPWTGQIYLMGHADGGPYPSKSNPKHDRHAGVLFVPKSQAGATWDWKLLDTIEQAGKRTYVMTSTPNHPLVVLDTGDGVPQLRWLESGQSKLTSGEVIAIGEDGRSIRVGVDHGVDDLESAQPGHSPCIARILATGRRDQVWIAYTTLNESGRQVYRIATVTFGGSQIAVARELTTIESIDPANRSVTLGAFVQDDRVNGKVDNPNNLTLFYWVDAAPKGSPDADKLYVRYKILRGSRGQTQTGDLSVSHGEPRHFPRGAIGDYFKGGYFEWDDKVHFLAQWPEGGRAGAASAVRANVVSIKP